MHSERVSNLLKATQLACGRAAVWAQMCPVAAFFPSFVLHLFPIPFTQNGEFLREQCALQFRRPLFNRGRDLAQSKCMGIFVGG